MLGTRVGHYRLVAKLGKGGFGTVYRGEHVHLDDIRVAVKVFHADLVRDETFVPMLQRECRVLHRLAHPGIVAFRDLVITDDTTAIVLELLEGEDIYRLLHRQGRLPIERVLHLLRGALEPLGYAHRQGVVHRDVKPGNLFLCEDGSIKIMDFGIAKAALHTQATKSGVLSGSLDYMSSERFAGDSLPASDLYALGLVAWELLVGHTACPEGDLPVKMGWHVKVGAPSVRLLRPDCPAWFSDFVARLTAVHADARPIDGAMALAELDALTAPSRDVTRPVPAPPPLTVPLPAPRPPAVRSTPTPTHPPTHDHRPRARRALR